MIKKIIDANIRQIEDNKVLIYKEHSKYFVVYKDVFVLYGLCRFCFYRVGNIFEMEISKNYLNYVLKKLRSASISYLVIDKLNQYHVLKEESFFPSFYESYYLKGRRFYRRKKQVLRITKQISNALIHQDKIKEIYYLLEGECHEII